MNSDYQLFLGFPVTEAYQQQLNLISPEICSIFIQDHSDYLQPATLEGQTYLGKRLNVPVDISLLECIQDHIYSLLKRLIPAYSYKDSSLVLLTIPC